MTAVSTRRQNANDPPSKRGANARISTRNANSPRHRAATEGGGVLRVLEMPRFPAILRIVAEREALK